ncbi:uncharacterized protein LOC554678 precursor [Danio rerio]|uniref:Si:rp71-1i20.2 n=1 Tax=Danio rerio TaxID=7955 RepID=A8DZ56_DANRE|nr:uncharacterized protein LOC554678 precursor [Danio rerio]|eukprot:XP_009294254.1 uncharacterized protein LOC554678 isoform X1 [Danio rerio]
MKFVFSVLAVLLCFLNNDMTGVYADAVLVSVTVGDSVTLHTAGVKNLQPADVKWYFNDIRIAQLDGDLRFNCTDIQCNDRTEIFIDRLRLDRKTGALTIVNITNTHSGVYQLVVIGGGGTIFNVTVHDDPATHYNKVKKNQGESVTFNPGVRRDQIVELKCLLNNTLIAEISVNQSQICADVQCKERFTDRLKLDNESASLTITKTSIKDSGNYKLVILISSDRRFSITREKRFSLTVTSLSPSQLSGGAIAGIVVMLLLLL